MYIRRPLNLDYVRDGTHKSIWFAYTSLFMCNQISSQNKFIVIWNDGTVFFYKIFINYISIITLPLIDYHKCMFYYD